MRVNITEEMNVQKEWYDAKPTLAELPEFLRHLTEDYDIREDDLEIPYPIHIVFIDVFGDAQIVKVPDDTMSITIYTKNINDNIICKAKFADRLVNERLHLEDYNP